MLDKLVEICPFRVNKRVQMTITGESEVISEFEPCLKKRCPAYHSKQGNYGAYIERCMMFEREKRENGL